MPLKIKPVAPTDYHNIITIANQCFGPDYLTLNQLTYWLSTNNYSITLVIDETPQGYCLAIPATIYNDELPNLPNLHKAIIIKQLAITAPFRTKGFGAMLLNAMLTELKKVGYTTILYPMWTENCPDYFCKKLDKTGFKPIETIHHFWFTDSLTKGYYCPICGAPPCRCSLTWYVLS